MDVVTLNWGPRGWVNPAPEKVQKSQWVVYFGSRKALAESKAFEFLKQAAPGAVVMGCSTGGEIAGTEVYDDTVVAAAVRFEHTQVGKFVANIDEAANSKAVGRQLAEGLIKPGLTHIFLLTDGLHVNGSDLVEGIFEKLPPGVTVTGGLAGDGADFKLTEAGLDEPPAPRRVTAVGFYGGKLRIGYGSVGGWDAFGPERLITKSAGNVLYELDHAPALDLYKSYLGEAAAKLPGSALLFPLTVRAPEGDANSSIVRTIVGVDEAAKSLIFAGDVPQGHFATLMHGNFEHLIDGAGDAADMAKPGQDWRLAVLISCIGRKLLLGQRIADETQAVADTLGEVPTLGFYSYGEICHHRFTQKCGLHNQTMTVTLFAEE